MGRKLLPKQASSALLINPAAPSTLLTPRTLSTDNTINLIIGVLTIAVGILSTILAWAMWRLTSDGRRRVHLRSQSSSPSPSLSPPPSSPIELVPTQASIANRNGYEVAFRIGRST
ncbi:hypothetical protein LCER1_G000145 [Lachnellula cervina]|uniref:Uncharacterized protein n=1 Tax=Lachnellula cervina TaxID=1316786 RepID=A0A7D8V228_9HELO|nr:hypothetical protein LCER1_G000145 [Lachnellula cervina]